MGQGQAHLPWISLSDHPCAADKYSHITDLFHTFTISSLVFTVLTGLPASTQSDLSIVQILSCCFPTPSTLLMLQHPWANAQPLHDLPQSIILALLPVNLPTPHSLWSSHTNHPPFQEQASSCQAPFLFLCQESPFSPSLYSTSNM